MCKDVAYKLFQTSRLHTPLAPLGDEVKTEMIRQGILYSWKYFAFRAKTAIFNVCGILGHRDEHRLDF